MKCKLALLCLFALVLTAKGADLTIQTNSVWVALGDSYWQSSDGNPSTGNRVTEYTASGMKLLQPYKNTHLFNYGESGINMDKLLTNAIPQAMGLWAFNSNSFQHGMLVLGTDNGSLSSNLMYLANSNCAHAPSLISDGGLTLTNNGGQYAKPIDFVACGYYPSASDDGSPDTEGARNNASVNAGNNFGVLGIDGWGHLANAWTNDWQNNGGRGVDWVFPSGISHFLSGGAISASDVTLAQMLPSMTNVTTIVIDWNGTVVTTNHCLVTSVGIGSTLSFDLIEYALPPAYDHPGDVVPDGVITNDASKAFVMVGNWGNFWHQTMQITNLPAGTYNVREDGEVTATLSSTLLGVSWNRATNNIGPTWRKRVKVLADIRDVDHVDEVTLTHKSVDGTGIFSYGSTAAIKWPTFQGDAFIAQMAANAKSCFDLDDIANADAQPVTRHFIIEPVGAYAPAPFR